MSEWISVKDRLIGAFAVTAVALVALTIWTSLVWLGCNIADVSTATCDPTFSGTVRDEGRFVLKLWRNLR